MKSLWIVLSCLFLLAGLTAQDRMAVAEPAAKGGMSSQEVETIWGMLESSADGGYEMISRSALKQMLVEIGLSDSSGLMNLNSTQKAKLGQLKGVKYLLVSTVGKFGTRINLSMMILDSSTGEIDPDKKISETVNSLDELADKLPDMLQEMGLGRKAKKRGYSALLIPIVKTPAPSYVGEEFNVRLENLLLANQVKLRNLQSVAKILKKNKIDALYEAEPAMYSRIGGLLRVDLLLQVTINRFTVDLRSEYIQATRKNVVHCIGNIEGNIRIVSAQNGELIASVPFRGQVDSDDFDSSIDTDNWTRTDYGKFMIERMVPVLGQQILPKLK